jgi:hypothetical protein
MASTANNSLQGFEWRLQNLIESTMKCYLHRRGQADYLTGKFLVNVPIWGEKAHNHSVSLALTAHLYLSAYLLKLGFGINKIPCPWTDKHMGSKSQLLDTIAYVFFSRGGAPHLKLAAQLYSFCSARSRMCGRLA